MPRNERIYCYPKVTLILNVHKMNYSLKDFRSILKIGTLNELILNENKANSRFTKLNTKYLPFSNIKSIPVYILVGNILTLKGYQGMW